MKPNLDGTAMLKPAAKLTGSHVSQDLISFAFRRDTTGVEYQNEALVKTLMAKQWHLASSI